MAKKVGLRDPKTPEYRWCKPKFDIKNRLGLAGHKCDRRTDERTDGRNCNGNSGQWRVVQNEEFRDRLYFLDPILCLVY